TGPEANGPGSLVGGKTGTAEKQVGRGYGQNARIASFVAAFPMTAPRYVILAMVDEPKPNATSHGYATGGWVVAPAIARFIKRMAPLVGLPPIDEKSPEAQNELLVAVNATEPLHAPEGPLGRPSRRAAGAEGHRRHQDRRARGRLAPRRAGLPVRCPARRRPRRTRLHRRRGAARRRRHPGTARHRRAGRARRRAAAA